MGALKRLHLEEIVERKTRSLSPYKDKLFSEDIEKYDKTVTKNAGKKSFELQNLFEKMNSMGLAIEQQALKENVETMRVQLIRRNYKQFKNLDFLSEDVLRKGKVKHNGSYSSKTLDFQVYLPRWGIFTSDKETDTVGFEAQTYFADIATSAVFYWHDIDCPEVMMKQIIDVLEKNLPKGSYKKRNTEVRQNRYVRRATRFSNVKEERLRNFGVIDELGTKNHSFSFSTRLNVQIPDNARNEIEKSFKIFGPRNVYFIAERTAKDWIYTQNANVISFALDPLVVGYHPKEGTFLVTKFDSTFNEAKVVRDYT